MKQNRRPQKQKNPNVIRVQELRRSSAADPRPSGNDYKRKPKHAGRGWE